MALSPADLKLLRRIVETGHRLEASWTKEPSEGWMPDSPALEILAELKARITEIEKVESPDLKRLAGQREHLTATMTARHLGAALVPFERLLGRALRDDEFLVTERDADGASESLPATAPLTVVADNLRSAFNVGAIMRTSECFGVERVILAGYTPTPDEEKTSKTSMGTQNYVTWVVEPKAVHAIDNLKRDGYRVVALETVEGATDLSEFQWPEKTALLLGNERFGVDHELLAKADHLVRIPLHGRKNSLNVGIAFGIAAADWRRKLDAQAGAATGDTLTPIGVFHSPATHPYEAPRQGVINPPSETGWIELRSGRQFEQALEDLSGFERIWLLYRFHHNTNWKPKTVPPRGPAVKRGVFATRSPYRPNPLGLSCVELVRVEGLKVHVRGFDLLDGTPIYDIKPYLPYADAFPNVKAGWVDELKNETAYGVEFSPQADEQLSWLESRGVHQLRGFLQSQLEYAPLDSGRKRVSAASTSKDTSYVIAYRTWRVRFGLVELDARVTIDEIFSGYSEADLANPDDRYGDKAIHRSFSEKFGPRDEG